MCHCKSRAAIALFLAVCPAMSGRGSEPGTLHDGAARVAPAEVRALLIEADVPDVPQAVIDATDGLPPWGRELGQSPAGEPAPIEAGVEFTPQRAARPALSLNVEYLLWWTRNQSAPPLITRGELSDALPGALGQPYTKLLYGGIANDINFQDRHGGRFTFCWRDSEGVFGLEASYLFLTARAVGTAYSSPGSPVLAQPFYDAVNNRFDSLLASYPGLASGSISVRSSSLLQGAEVNGTGALWQRDQNRLVAITGLRYLNLHEDLQISSFSTGVPPTFVGNAFVGDRFVTWSEFYGAQVGVAGEFHYRRLQLDLLAKVALGDSHEASQIAGRTMAAFPNLVGAPAGFLALASNSGSLGRNQFAVVPEAGVTLGFRITNRLTLNAGYTFLYWSEVARPASQIDIRLNPNLIPSSLTYGAPGGPARPAAAVHGTDFWAQGLNVGLLLRY